MQELRDFAENERGEVEESNRFSQRRENLQQGASLRSQHILDKSQESARRSHIYDGIPVIIEGGPGTGKTTTVIQRLNFLLDAEAMKESIKEYEKTKNEWFRVGATATQIDRLLGSSASSNKWLFFAPSSLLLQYLRNNMQGEGLNPSDKNSRTITEFRRAMFQEYKISSTSSKIKQFEDESKSFILAPKKMIEYFKNYCVNAIEEKRERLSVFEVDTTIQKKMNRIHDFCRNYKVKDFSALLEFLHLLYVIAEDKKIPESVKEQFPDFFSGVEKAFLEKIPQMYLDFRRQENKDCLYDRDLYGKIVQSDDCNYLHIDEQDFLLGFINETIIEICTKNPTRLNTLTGNFASSYKRFCTPIIVIDEATDYTLMDFYCMKSFRHYEISSITLSGDLMQETQTNGIQSWDELDEIFPQKEKYTLNISYRQTPTLVNIAKNLYLDSLGDETAYNSHYSEGENEAKPQLLISNNEREKANWIAEQIASIRNKLECLPSTAIFIGDDCDGANFARSITDTGKLNGINVVFSEEAKALAATNTVRVFRMSNIKGMEFESVFLYDIDRALKNQSVDLMRRILYVGISRAANYLAATMTSPNGDIAKYFEPTQT